jgi:hypothetical protein
MAKSTLDYINHNKLTITTALLFTCKDYDYLVTIQDPLGLTINGGRKGREESLTKEDIVNRIRELYLLSQLREVTLFEDFNWDAVTAILDKEGVIDYRLIN